MFKMRSVIRFILPFLVCSIVSAARAPSALPTAKPSPIPTQPTALPTAAPTIPGGLNLLHDYTFSGSVAVDSVGRSNGTLIGMTAVSGQAIFPGGSTGNCNSYISLPSNTLNGLTSMAVELIGVNTSTSNPQWTRLLQFGPYSYADDQSNSIALTHDWSGNLDLQIIGLSEYQTQFVTTTSFAGLQNMRILLVLLAGEAPALYLNGVPAVWQSGAPNALSALPTIGSFFIGKSFYTSCCDSCLGGSIKRIRLWGRVAPTLMPTTAPPTAPPTRVPTAPTAPPTRAPSPVPTRVPTGVPTSPSPSPTPAPTAPTAAPTLFTPSILRSKMSLLHDYTFSGKAAVDSVGRSDGTLIGMTAVAGQAIFPGGSSGNCNSYISLPSTVFGDKPSIAVELIGVNTTTSNSQWTRLFQFGPLGSVNDQWNSIALTHDDWSGNLDLQIIGLSEYQTQFVTTTSFAGLQNMRILLVLLAGEAPALYLNGAPAVWQSGAPNALSALPTIGSFFVGKSFYDGDSCLGGSMSRIRLWGTGLPTISPTPAPSRPTAKPTRSPSGPTSLPSAAPTIPTAAPIRVPSRSPSSLAGTVPSAIPSRSPTCPTAVFTPSPSAVPTRVPSRSPTGLAGTVPSAIPSRSPTCPPAVFTASPSAAPTRVPSRPPSGPTCVPSSAPSAAPTALPALAPTLALTSIPSRSPTVRPTATPLLAPSRIPTGPTRAPQSVATTPSTAPSRAPSRAPTGPTRAPQSLVALAYSAAASGTEAGPETFSAQVAAGALADSAAASGTGAGSKTFSAQALVGALLLAGVFLLVVGRVGAGFYACRKKTDADSATASASVSVSATATQAPRCKGFVSPEGHEIELNLA